MLHLAKCGSCHAGDISNLLPLSQSTVSQHMAKLKAAGLIECSPSGVCQNYRISNKNFNQVKAQFFSLVQSIDQAKEKL